MRTNSKQPAAPTPIIPTCERCEKVLELCVCTEIKKATTRLRYVILQHPQEPDTELGSAKLTELCLKSATLKVGLSWPNLKKVVDLPEVNNQQWGVVYLGSGVKGEKPSQGALIPVDKKGVFANTVQLRQLQGLIFLDGTWSQAKALWWRNAWLLKLQRIVLNPKSASMYRELRKEPRRECLSTIESVALCIEELESKEVAEELRSTFKKLLDKKRALKAQKADEK